MFFQLLEKGLQVFPYPTDEKEEPTSPPISVSLTLPDSAVFLETPQVARWDVAGRADSNTLFNISSSMRKIFKIVLHLGKQWRMDGITDVSYEKDEAKISFKVDSFWPIVLMQETYANLPFQSWELRPLGQDSALFTINGALSDLSITIQVRDRRGLLTQKNRSG